MNKAFIPFFAAFFVFASLASALDITISLSSNDTFSEGDEVIFGYTLTADSDVTVTYLPYVNCLAAPMPPMIEKTVDLQAGIPFTSSFTAFNVEDYIESQDCSAYIQLIDPIQKKEEKLVRVETKPSFSFSLMSCKDLACNDKTRVFTKGSAIYLDYSSDISGLDISAKLKYPDNNEENVNLPLSISAGQIGTYNIEVNAVKEGYKEYEGSIMFGVIESELEIPSEEPNVPSTDEGSPSSSSGSEEHPSPSLGSPSIQQDTSNKSGRFDGLGKDSSLVGSNKDVPEGEAIVESEPANDSSLHTAESNIALKWAAVSIIAVIFLLIVVYFRIKKRN